MKALGDAIGRDGKTLAQGQQSWSGWIRMGSAVPLAWRNLSADKRRLLRATGGIAFAVLLMMIRLGFREAFLDSALAIIRNIDGDIFMTSATKFRFGWNDAFSYRELYRARAIQASTGSGRFMENGSNRSGRMRTPTSCTTSRFWRSIHCSRSFCSRRLRVDAETGEEVANEDIVKGYPVDKDTYLVVTKEELENIALESTRTIDIDEFVKREEIDPRYIIRPYYLTPEGKVGHDAFAVIRETIRSMDMVAVGRVVLTNREHIIALEPKEKGLVGALLRYPYEVRNEGEYFDEIQDVKITKDMLDLAKHIVNSKSGQFEPVKFEDHYEAALIDLINKKRNGQPSTAKARSAVGNVVNLMDALRASLGQEQAPKTAKKPKKAASQKEMLLPIDGKKPAKEGAAKKSASKSQRRSA